MGLERRPAPDFPTSGVYFDTTIHDAPVAYAEYLEGNNTNTMPKCLLRYWTIGEIITAIAWAAGRRQP